MTYTVTERELRFFSPQGFQKHLKKVCWTPRWLLHLHNRMSKDWY